MNALPDWLKGPAVSVVLVPRGEAADAAACARRLDEALARPRGLIAYALVELDQVRTRQLVRAVLDGMGQSGVRFRLADKALPLFLVRQRDGSWEERQAVVLRIAGAGFAAGQ